MDYVNQTFENDTVELDGNSFKDCTFRDVTFLYSGGDLRIEDCTMNRFRFQFGGNLSNGLFALYQWFGSDGLMQIIRGFIEPSAGEVELAVPSKQQDRRTASAT